MLYNWQGDLQYRLQVLLPFNVYTKYGMKPVLAFHVTTDNSYYKTSYSCSNICLFLRCLNVSHETKNPYLSNV